MGLVQLSYWSPGAMPASHWSPGTSLGLLLGVSLCVQVAVAVLPVISRDHCLATMRHIVVTSPSSGQQTLLRGAGRAGAGSGVPGGPGQCHPHRALHGESGDKCAIMCQPLLPQVKCSEAWNISIKYDRAIANSFAGANYISEHDRRLRTIK